VNLDALSPAQLAELRQQLDQAQAKRAGKPRRRSYDQNSHQYLEEAEIDALISAASANPRDVAIFEVAYHRGLRASEVGMLKVDDVRLGQRSRDAGRSVDRIFVRRLKGGESKSYIMTVRESKAVRRWLTVRGRAPGPLFPSRHDRPISRQRLDELIKYYGAHANLPPEKRHFHCLRHTAGTFMAERADPVEVQDHLGHRDIRSTMRYVKVRSKRRDELGERLAREW
jgi:integrase